jgi:AcrR family transcriptional regulator
MQDPDDIKADITAAAQQRFRNYGYGKTTMAEIAADVNMSAANLYRYFSNKQDIAAVCARQCMDELQEQLKSVLTVPNATAEQRLHQFVQTCLHYHYGLMHESPRLNELVDTISQHHRELIYERNISMEGVIAEIIEMGIGEGLFKVHNVADTAAAILKSTVLFTSPFFMHLYTLEEFEKMAVDVVTLIINGLKTTT